MILLDFFTINTVNVYLVTILISTFYLSDKKLYYILFWDLLLNGFPLVTILIIIFTKINNIVFLFLSENIYSKLILITIYYYMFGIFIYGTHNELNMYILNYLKEYYLINIFIYYLVIKYLDDKYN